MKSIKFEFQNRCNTIKIFYEHIDQLQYKKKTVDISQILKSSFFVALYNNIEATLYSIFDKCHSIFIGTPYNKLSKELKDLFVIFYLKKGNKINSNVIDTITYKEFPKFHEYLKNFPLFSGNLDVHKVKEIYKKYGINDVELCKIHKNVSTSILNIKNMRNVIAHGEKNLLQGGQNYSTKKIKVLMDDCEFFLGKCISIVEHYLSNEQYLSSCEQPT